MTTTKTTPNTTTITKKTTTTRFNDFIQQVNLKFEMTIIMITHELISNGRLNVFDKGIFSLHLNVNQNNDNNLAHHLKYFVLK